VAAVGAADDEVRRPGASSSASARADSSSDEIVRAHYAAIFQYALRRTRSREAAEDVTQEVFAAAVRAGVTVRTDGAAPWLFAVAKRRLIDAARRSRREEVSLNDAVEVEAHARDPHLVPALVKGLMRVPPLERRVLVLRLLEGRPFEEIAEVVGATPMTCRMRFSRGCSALRAALREAGLAPARYDA
jgi:RNA polymerase sigma-70 factor (ECF subfamily)